MGGPKNQGAPMIKNPPEGRWCDYCKMEWGKLDNGKRWHEKAMTPAVVLIVSETHMGKNNERAYCMNHRSQLSTWTNGEIWPLVDQMAYAKEMKVKQYELELKNV